MKIIHADPIFALKIITKLKAQQGKPADIFEHSAFRFELTLNRNGIIPKSRVKIDFHYPRGGPACPPVGPKEQELVQGSR